jgi:hypothetical protein
MGSSSGSTLRIVNIQAPGIAGLGQSGQLSTATVRR